ncbi:tmem164 [Symbiodinium sp. KB8]|nr:tmem164 [Symbiodinium sp. KB8]
MTDRSYHAGSSVSFSWYLTPRQHAAELMALNLVVIPLLVWLARRYTRAVGIKARPVDQMGWPLWLLDQAVHFTGLITLGFTLWYKYEKDAFVFMLQPCHISNTLMIIFWFFPGAKTGKDGKVVENTFINYLQAFNMDIWFGSLAALLMPDFRNTRLFLEKEMFIIQHGLLVALPFYYMAVRRYTVYSDFIHIFQNYLIFALIHWDVFSTVSIFWNCNVNYMAQPPNGFTKYGEWYRGVVMLQCLAATLAARYIFSGLWGLLVTWQYPYTVCCVRRSKGTVMGLAKKQQ